MDTLSEILEESIKSAIIEKCGEKPDKQGLQCPHCGAREVYASAVDPGNTEKWFWRIGAYKVDDSSKCYNCKQWF